MELTKEDRRKFAELEQIDLRGYLNAAGWQTGNHPKIDAIYKNGNGFVVNCSRNKAGYGAVAMTLYFDDHLQFIKSHAALQQGEYYSKDQREK